MKEIFENVLQLCSLECSEKEKEIIFADIENVVNYIKKLEEVDTREITPCCHVISNVQNVMREDIPEIDLSKDIFLSNAPETIGGMVKVPSVIE